MRSIWAVATNTIKQALRMKIAIVFIILLLVLLPVMGTIMTGDGTIKGRLQSFVSYGLSLTSFLLCLLTIVASIYSLTSDIQQKQIFTVVTKPIRRFQLLFGKLLGIILLDVVLLILFSAVIYTITIYMPKFLGADQDELNALNNEFYTARAGLMPPEVDVTEEAENIYQELKETGQLPEGISRREAIAEIAGRQKLAKRAAAPGQELLWEFNNVKPLDPNESIFIRFKYDVSVNPPDLQVFSMWRIGDYRQVKYGMKIQTPFYDGARTDLIRTFHEIEVPAYVVADDGYLAVRFFNDPRANNTVVIFPLEDGLEVLYKVDTFTANFIRAALLILLRLIFLACLGIFAATFLSFPVAILFCLVIFFTATISGFCLESFNFIGEKLSVFYSYTLKPIVQLLPQFDRFNPTKFMVSARQLSWHSLAKVAVIMIGIKASLSWILALLIFSFREIAKVII